MTGVKNVIAVLERAGYKRLRKPLTIVGTEFDFEAAASGTHTSHDLILVATETIPNKRLQRLVAGLARSLDLAASRRPVSLVLIGRGLGASDRTELERYARVLPIASSTPDIDEIEEAIAVLLPLKLPNAELVNGRDPVNETLAALGPLKVTRDHIALIEAAAQGSGGVREALRRYANEGAGWTDDLEGNDE